MSDKSAGRLFLAEAMNLHEKRVREAIQRSRLARQELVTAEAEQADAQAAFDEFKRFVTREGF